MEKEFISAMITEMLRWSTRDRQNIFNVPCNDDFRTEFQWASVDALEQFESAFYKAHKATFNLPGYIAHQDFENFLNTYGPLRVRGVYQPPLSPDEFEYSCLEDF